MTITASRDRLERDLAPFRRLVDGGVPLVMFSNASYTAFGPAPATWSRVVQALVRDQLGYGGVTITDSLDAPAHARGWPTSQAALLAARAGVDLLLVTGSEEASDAAFRALLADAPPRASLERSYSRVAALRARL